MIPRHQISPIDLVADIGEAVPQLLKLGRTLTRNDISDHYIFILSEITDEPTNAHQRRRVTKRLNDAKLPLPLADLAPALCQLHGNLHDIDLYIYQTTREVTIVD